MKRISRLMAIIISTIIFGSCIVGCGPAVIGGDDDGKTVINISLYQGGHGSDYMDALISNFMKANPEYNEKYKIKYDLEKLHAALIQDELEAGFGEVQMYIMAQNDFVHFIYSDYLEDISDVVEMKVDGESGKKLSEKMVRYDEWQSIYSKYGKGLYAMPYADSLMGWVYDHQLFVDKQWYLFANEQADGAKLIEQGISYTERAGKLIFESSSSSVNYDKGDKILSAGKDGKYGTYDDGQPVNEPEWENMIRRIDASGSKAFISSGKIGSYAIMLISSLFAQYDGLDAWNTYFTYDSKGQNVTLAGGTQTPITLQNGYRVNEMDGILKAYKWLEKYFNTNNENPSVPLSLHPAVSDGTKNHLDTQNLYLLGYQNTDINPQSAMLLEGTWWEYEARKTFETIGKLDATRGYGKRDYRYMLLPNLDGQKNEKSVMTSCESGAMIVPKDSNKDRLQVKKEFLAYMASDEALNIFLTMTGSIMPYKYTLSKEDQQKLTPFAKNMIELYEDNDNVDVVRPQFSNLWSPISYAGSRPEAYFVPKVNSLILNEPFKIVREQSINNIKLGLKDLHKPSDWAKYISDAKAQGFFVNE